MYVHYFIQLECCLESEHSKYRANLVRHASLNMFKFVPFHCAYIADPHSTGLNMRHHGTAGVVIRLTPHLTWHWSDPSNKLSLNWLATKTRVFVQPNVGYEQKMTFSSLCECWNFHKSTEGGTLTTSIYPSGELLVIMGSGLYLHMAVIQSLKTFIVAKPHLQRWKRNENCKQTCGTLTFS